MILIFMPDASGCKHSFRQRADPVAQRAHFGAGGIRPIHRQFQNPKAKHFGQHDHLDVEAEPILLDQREDGARGLPPECLEPALCIRQTGRPGQAQREIEEPPRLLPEPRLMDADHALPMPATADEHIGLLARAQEIANKPKRNAQVGIHKKNPLPARLEHAGADGEALAVRGGIRNNDKARIPFCSKAGSGFGVILARLDDQQKLPGFRRKCAANFPY